MEDFYIYILQVNIALFIFYLVYRLLFVRDTFLEFRRLFLLTAVVLAFSYPVISLSAWLEAQQPLQVVMVNYAEILVGAVAVVVPSENVSLFTWQNLVLVIWAIGSLFLMLRLLIQFFVVCRMILRGKKMVYRGYRVIALSQDMAPFSFFGWIFINPAYHQEKELSEIMAHEKTHVYQYHSIDMIIGEFLCIFFWFNPIIWLFRKEIRQNLEFLADKNVVTSGYNRKNYQYHLLRLSHQSTAVQIVNNFNVSPLKKRIIMMNKKRTSRIGLIKYALLIPLTGVLILSANAKTVVKVTENALREWKMVSPGDFLKDKEKTKLLKGKVMDESGAALPGVSIIIQGKGVGGVSDVKGEFKLEVSEPGNLCFSFIGRKTETLPFTLESPELTVKLEKDNFYLDKVVVTGYSSVKKKEPDPDAHEVAFVVVEEMPQFPGGNVLRFIAKSVRYPAIAMENGIQGTVFVSFIVNREGKVTDAKVVKSVDASLDKEALRVINALPDWKPGKQRGRAVDVQYTLPIEFMLVKNETTETVTVSKFSADTVNVTKMGETVTIVGKGEPEGETTSVKITEVETIGMEKSLKKNRSIKSALIVVDGEKMSAGYKIDDVAPDSIQSITVLKEETSLTIYGEDGKNGVIVITTKK